ncbi:hypothetical protein BKA62DRAFT_208633 [Auriculariales sp. MPI-PUGE-AT-0066]|nr:hypothetical protein BKA62DRAFT_208633 [Auriculariales sp. MPI-PUGE-AT-0066]
MRTGSRPSFSLHGRSSKSTSRTPNDGVCDGVLLLHPKWAGQNKWNETTQIDIPEYPKAKITVPPVELHIRLSVQRPVNVTLNYNTFERYTHSSFGLILVPLSAPSNVITRGWYNMSTDINRDDAFDTSVEGLEMEGSITLRPSLQWDIARNDDGADSAYQ